MEARTLKRRRALTKSDAATIISRAVKRAKTTPDVKSKFRITSRNNPAIFPARMRQTLVYSESIIITSTALIGIPQTTGWRLNGMFDPRTAVGGHQPMGFDQLMAMYTHFTVVGCKVTATFTSTDGSYYTGDCGINITDPNFVPSTSDALIESQYSTYGVYSQSANPTKLSIGVDLSKYFGVKDILDEGDLQGTAGFDPVRQAIGIIWLTNHKGVALPVNVTIKIEYDAMFVEPRNTLGS